LKRSISFLILLALYIFALSSTAYAESMTKGEDNTSYMDFLIRDAELPQIPQRPDMNSPSGLNNEILAQYNAYWEAKAEHQGIAIPDMELLQSFTRESTRKLIEDRETSNFLYSPVSLWLCLNTLTDLTDGDSRAQILQVIGQQTDEARKKQVDAVFRSLYWDDDASICIPAMSVWLNESTGISNLLLDHLAAVHAATFQGNMGEAAYTAALQAWLNEKTRDLLKDSVSNLSFSPDNGLAVSSTLYLKSGWLSRFSKDRTSPDVFYSNFGEVMTDFMHDSSMGAVYKGEGFTAVILDFEDGGGVSFILPDEGRSPEELLRTDDVFHFLFSGREWGDGLYGKINLSVPKMDCLSEMPLRSSLEQMGITDIFNSEKAQFSAEILSDSELAMSVLQQYARLIMNEDGVEAAAITISTDGALFRSPEAEIDFTLNRPFVYAVMSEKGIPLFIGTYREPK